jgi:hypothetical protein
MVINKARTNKPFTRVLRAYKLCLSVGFEQMINRTQ